jgi:HAD superfamily hydrolase (TIGR01490 family)
MKAAFFDIDHTLLDCNTQTVLAWYFFKKKILKVRHLKYLLLWKFVTLFHLELISSKQIREYCYAALAEYPKLEIDFLFKEFCNSNIPQKICSSGKSNIDRHKKSGYKIILVSATVENIACWLSGFLQADAVLSTKLEVRNGKYTGHLKGEVVEGVVKARLIQELSRKFDIDLKLSYAYGNSVQDINMLKLVGHAIAVNPDRLLKKTAKELNWKVEQW